MILQKIMLVLALSVAGNLAIAGPVSSKVDFSNGAQGWEGDQPLNGVGGSGIDHNMGNGAPALRTVIENFANAILHSETLIAPAAEGINSVMLANAIMMSSFEGKTINLPLDENAYEQKLRSLIK